VLAYRASSLDKDAHIMPTPIIEKEQFDNPLRLSIQLHLGQVTRYVLFQKDQIILDENHSPFLTEQHAQSLLSGQAALFVGYTKEQECADIHTARISTETKLPEGMKLSSLRSLVLLEHPSLPKILGRARQLLDWHENHKFCGRCGGKTEQVAREYSFKCSSCKLYFYPRISPCVIVLIKKGDYCLLAKGAHRTINFYSTLAGFMEPGETPEQAVKREVWEETGIKIKNLRYFGSQSWPFPSQLMLGYIADYRSGEIDINPDELEDAQWFHFDDLPTFPPITSIAGRLIEEGLREFNNK
jgi:NAD+ diphosphatase